MKEKLEVLYRDIKSVPNFSAKITKFLQKDDVHGVYRRITKKKFPRRRVIARFPFELWMGDLFQYTDKSDVYLNRQYKYVLLLIDCFTKMIYVAPMKKKMGQWAADAFESIFKTVPRLPVNLVTDGGTEFFNSDVQKVFDSYGIHHYRAPTRTAFKASVAERAVRTIKTRLQRYFKVRKQRKWIDVIDQIVENYNNTPHSATGLPPLDVNDSNRKQVYKKLYPESKVSVVCRLKVGDRVRKLRQKEEWEKGYTENWSEEIYIVASVRQSYSVCFYKISDLSGKILPGIWYYYELNFVARNDNKSVRKTGSNQSKET